MDFYCAKKCYNMKVDIKTRMEVENMKNEMVSKIFFGLSVVAVILSALVSLFGMEMWLAGSQWMLVAIVLGVWAIFAKK